MLTRQQKEELVKELEVNFAKAKSVVFVNFAPKDSNLPGLSVVEVDGLRKQLKETGISYKAIKKTLVSRILRDMGVVEGINLDGQVAVAIDNEDEVTSARVLNKFAKGKESFELLGGISDGKFLNKQEIIALATLPSKDELRARLVGTIAAPLSGFVNVLQGNIRGLVYALQAIADQQK